MLGLFKKRAAPKTHFENMAKMYFFIGDKLISPKTNTVLDGPPLVMLMVTELKNKYDMLPEPSSLIAEIIRLCEPKDDGYPDEALYQAVDQLRARVLDGGTSDFAVAKSIHKNYHPTVHDRMEEKGLFSGGRYWQDFGSTFEKAVSSGIIK